MSKLIKSVTGRVGKKSEAKRQAKKVGAKIGKPSERAKEASEREFAAPSVSDVLGGTAGPGFGASPQHYRKRPLKRSR